MAEADPPATPSVTRHELGEMDRRIRDFDWHATPLGPRENWPATLKAAVSVCLGTRFPMHVWWGRDPIKLYNDAHIAILGKRHPRALGQPVREVWPEVWGSLKPQIESVMRDGIAMLNRETHVVLERGGRPEDAWFTWSYSPLRDESGAIVGLHGIAIEDTARKAAERALVETRGRLEKSTGIGATEVAGKWRLLESERMARSEAERAGRMKDEFLATLSHELRSPLNAIIGWSQILLKTTRDATDSAAGLTEGLRTIERNARAQAQIIENMLDMSRIVSGKVRLEVQQVDLASVVRDAIETTKAAADAKGIRLQLQQALDVSIPPISGDPNRLRQIFWNLLSNAVKFTPRGGRVQILMERAESHLEVSVIDSGEGMKAEFLPNVFDGFRQADSSITRRHGGLGLGLAIVKQLVELHGGSVTATSEGMGYGSKFVVSLPMTAVLQTEEIPRERRHAHGGIDLMALPLDPSLIRGVKVLVVDDEEDAREMVKRLLEDCEAVVRVAASAGEAIASLLTERPDVLISDIGMPEQDGYSLIRRVRALGAAQGGNVPAVALTAYARSEDRTRSILAGYQMHIPKPVEPAELIAMVTSLAGRNR